MTFYTILCLTNTKVIRKHAKEIIAELTIRTIEDWTPKNRIASMDLRIYRSFYQEWRIYIP